MVQSCLRQSESARRRDSVGDGTAFRRWGIGEEAAGTRGRGGPGDGRNRREGPNSCGLDSRRR
jgi:hypothetical protein